MSDKNLKIGAFSGAFSIKTFLSDGGYRFSLDISELDKNAKYGVAVYDREHEMLISRYEFSEADRTGNVYSGIIPEFDSEKYVYNYYCNDYYMTDERAERFSDHLRFGTFDITKPRKAIFDNRRFPTKKPHIPFDEMFIYLLHVRGFTMHASSGVKHKGTFKGVSEKIAYLKKLGVTSIELQPAYEFNENDIKTGRYNYWGYCRGYYYAPKSAYSSSDDPCQEFADMIDAFHKEGMEVIMQMYFPESFPRREIPTILEFWTAKYGVDGFHVLGVDIPLGLIDESGLLADSKIFADNLYGIKQEKTDFYDSAATSKRYGLFRYDYMYNMRRFLKGDPNSLSEAVMKIKSNPAGYGVINFFDTYNTFTLADCVTYDHKHNESNGEDNHDGDDNNCTWNCGVEGPTKKPKINVLRNKQIKNALMLLFASSGVPLIFMGDEFGNTQEGNNNPYCHDSLVTWLDWKGLKRKNSFYEFISEFARIRRENNFYHGSRELSPIDTEGCGYPEVSFHGENAWLSDIPNYVHSVGIMICHKGMLHYLAINMHWDKAMLALPRAPKGQKWEIKFSSDEVSLLENEKVSISDRSIAYIVSVPDKSAVKEKPVKKTKSGNVKKASEAGEKA